MRATAWILAASVFFGGSSSRAAVVITEWMYNPVGATSGEFVEITNQGPAPVNMTNWSFDDNTRTSGSLSLSSLGTLAVGESAIITELAEAAFRLEWPSAPTLLKIIGGSTQNLSRSDEINIYDGVTLADRLTYNDQGAGNEKGPRTQGISGNPPLAALGANHASLWVPSSVGDAYGSFTSVSLDVGNPGKFTLVPEPASLSLLAAGAGLMIAKRRRS